MLRAMNQSYYHDQADGPWGQPPPYQPLTSTTTIPSSLHPSISRPPHPTSAPRDFKAVAIPQVSKGFDSEIESPFLRAYSPDLSDLGISKAGFLSFLDGLNESWIANPALQATTIAGAVMGAIPTVEIIGLAVETAGEVGSEATSYFRTKAYMKNANESIFYPKGLSVRIGGFEEMCRLVGADAVGIKGWVERESLVLKDKQQQSESDAKVNIEMLEQVAGGGKRVGALGRRHPRMKILQALEMNAAPLEVVDGPAPVSEQNVLKKWNAAYAAREGQKQSEKLEKKHQKLQQERGKKYQEAVKETQRKDKKIAELQDKIQKLQQDADMKSEKREKEISRVNDKIDRVRREQEEGMAEGAKRGDKEMHRFQQKELEKALKIKWLVICSADIPSESLGSKISSLSL
ncbi:hypothetical protein BJY04DRAFT_187214 [Aspergillus karnatakaensis]|uniref:uncharacterized protein n=1 Tax=Aspergillus karnatakaensis TaxID=1810916 RepID=UPI003CCD902E